MKKALILFVTFLSLTGISQKKETIFTCINLNGEKLFSIRAYSVNAFSDGLAEISRPVLEGQTSFRKYGFIDETGTIVIPCKYYDTRSFKYGVAWVKDTEDGPYYLINKKGETIGTTKWKKIGSFIEGFSAVYDDEGKMGFVNRKGELVIPCKYLGDGFSEGLACVTEYNSEKELYGFIDTTGKVVIPFQYAQAGTSSFRNGECRVQINGVTCLINPKGEVVFKPTLTRNCMGFSSGLCATYANSSNRSEWGYYNRNNEWVIQPKYDHAEDFQNGLAIVGIGEKYGVIDSTGKIVIPIQYASIFGHPEETGFFGLEMEMNGAKTYVRADGKPFTDFPIKFLIDPNGYDVYPYASVEGAYGYLNEDGTVFIKAQFDRASQFSEGKAIVQGDVSNLKMAPGKTEKNFDKNFEVGEKVLCQKSLNDTYKTVTVNQVTDLYYLVQFEDGSQVWVTHGQLKR